MCTLFVCVNNSALVRRIFPWIDPIFLSFQVRTLFVSGLPMDAKPRELYLLFRGFKVKNNWLKQFVFLQMMFDTICSVHVTPTYEISQRNCCVFSSSRALRFSFIVCANLIDRQSDRAVLVIRDLSIDWSNIQLNRTSMTVMLMMVFLLHRVTKEVYSK